MQKTSLQSGRESKHSLAGRNRKGDTETEGGLHPGSALRGISASALTIINSCILPAAWPSFSNQLSTSHDVLPRSRRLSPAIRARLPSHHRACIQIRPLSGPPVSTDGLPTPYLPRKPPGPRTQCDPTALPFAPNPARPARVAACFSPDLAQQTGRLRRWPTSHHTLSATGPHQSVSRSVSFRYAWLAMNRLARYADTGPARDRSSPWQTPTHYLDGRSGVRNSSKATGHLGRSREFERGDGCETHAFDDARMIDYSYWLQISIAWEANIP